MINSSFARVGADSIVNFNSQNDTLELDHFANAQPTIVRFRPEVKEGEVGVATSTSGKYQQLDSEGRWRPAPIQKRSILDIPDVGAGGLLIIRNESFSGLSRVVVHSIDVLRAN